MICTSAYPLTGTIARAGITPAVRRGRNAFLLHDTFTDTNGTDLASHTMDIGNGWTRRSTIPNGITIQGNQARFTGSFSAYTADAGVSDCWVRTTIVTVANTYCGICFRCSDGDNGWFVSSAQTADLNIYLSKIEAGTQTTVTQASHTAAPGDISAVRLEGSDIKVYINDVLKLSYTSSFNQSVTHHGVGSLFASVTSEVDEFNVVAL